MKKIIILILYPSICFSGEFIGKIESIKQQGNILYFYNNSIEYYTDDLSMSSIVLDCYKSEFEVLVNYIDLGHALVFISTQDTLYPVKDFSKIFSFVIGGISAGCFVFGIKLKYST